MDYWYPLRKTISQTIYKLWENPELPLMEYRSVDILTDWLKKESFCVQQGIGGIPTAFRATYGSGSPIIGILAEYDAMKGLSNDSTIYRKSLGQAAGHACMHCHIGGSNVGAAVAIKRYLANEKKTGTVVVVGCPAEEIMWGKIALLGVGGFDGLDCVLTCHVDYQNAAVSRPTLSFFSGEFCFGGISSHTGAARAHNALDGAELAIATIERMRGHQFPKTSVEHILRNCGDMPNITPDRASLWINVRDENYESAKSTYEYIRQIAQNSAKIAGVDVVEGFLSGCRGYLPNETLGKIMFKSLKSVNLHEYSQDELDQIAELSHNATNIRKAESFPAVQYINEGVDPYSQDDGEVSWNVPLGRVNWEIPLSIPLHNWATTALAGMEFSHRGALMASETLYLAAIELFEDPGIVEQANFELAERVKQAGGYIPAEYGSFNELTSDPESFWSGTWLNEKF